MEWQELKDIKRFEDIDPFLQKNGVTKLKIEDRPLYNLKNGFFLSYTPRKFNIVNLQREEYGVPGEYALSIYYLIDKESVLKVLNFSAVFENVRSENGIFEIVDGVLLGDSYKNVVKILKSNSSLFREGKTAGLVNGNMEFKYSWVETDDFVFYFINQKKPVLIGFRYTCKD